MLGGLAFALLCSTLAIPLAWMADRTSRTWVITVSLAIWSGFTAACGWATTGLVLYLVAALLMWLAARPLRNDWVA